MENILYGFVNALKFTNIIAALLSVAIGIVVGSLPGLSAAMGVALLIPITFRYACRNSINCIGRGLLWSYVWWFIFSYFATHTWNISAAAQL